MVKNKKIIALKLWFNKQSQEDKLEILNFLYEGMLKNENDYIGPDKEFITEGLFCGPVPKTSTLRCPRCGRSL